MIKRNAKRSYPRLEALEARLVLSGPGDFVMVSASAVSLTQIDVKYEVDNAALTHPYRVGIFRSIDNKFSAHDPRLGSMLLKTSDLTVGMHDTVVTLAAPRGIDPIFKYVLAVGVPAGHSTGSVPASHVASFRAWTVAAVTHGYTTGGAIPSWVTDMTTALSAQGFDATIPFNWASLSDLPVSGIVPQVAQGLAAQVETTIAGLGLGPNDVVDIQLIGHSRGTGVVAEAAGLLPTTVGPLKGGNLKLTLLDPHPARNDAIAYYSYDNGPIGQLGLFSFLAFQNAAADPKVVIPSDVTQAEVFYEHALVQHAVPINPDELFLMSWGNTPIAGNPIGGIKYYNLTKLAPSHEDTHVYYLNKIVPTLGRERAYPIHAVRTPGAPKGGGPSFKTTAKGLAYEEVLFVKFGAKPAVARTTLGDVTQLDQDIAATLLDPTQIVAARSELTLVTAYVSGQSGTGIPTTAADELLAVFQTTHDLLYPPVG
jgi:hypothetical protein